MTPPWNFPVAIPIGGVLAALAAGSAVVVKPAPSVPGCTEVAVAAVRTALAHGGAPADILQVVRADEGDVGRALVAHRDVDTVLLTGSIETARLFSSWRAAHDGGPRVYAETSGKNALVITSAADYDLAVADLVKSAFGHAGQKCSAASLVILVGSAGRSERLRRQLVDAVESVRVGWPTSLDATMGPLIEPPTGKLARALTSLEPGETWLVEPQQLDDTGRLWSPGLKDGVAPGSFLHLTECFGPVLGIMRADTLDEALALQNATPFGLTGGLHSLDEDEIEQWLDAVEVGNAYVNRHITGAIVQRQPFGGWKDSVVGPGAKAGGPNYVAQLGSWVPERRAGGARGTRRARAPSPRRLHRAAPVGLRPRMAARRGRVGRRGVGRRARPGDRSHRPVGGVERPAVPTAAGRDGAGRSRRLAGRAGAVAARRRTGRHAREGEPRPGGGVRPRAPRRADGRVGARRRAAPASGHRRSRER